MKLQIYSRYGGGKEEKKQSWVTWGIVTCEIWRTQLGLSRAFVGDFWGCVRRGVWDGHSISGVVGSRGIFHTQTRVGMD
jgi:hypothetical protein